MAENKVHAEHSTNNTLNVYYALDEAMVKACLENDKEYAESTARILLKNVELPLLIRARACMVLGCSNDPDHLEMAKEAVRVAELAHSLCSDPGELVKNLVEDCQTVLRESQEAWDHGVGVQDDDPEAGELVSKAEEEQVKASDVLDAASAKEEQASSATGGPLRKLRDPPLKASNSKMKRLVTDPQKMTRIDSSPPSRAVARADAEVNDEEMGEAQAESKAESEGKDEEMGEAQAGSKVESEGKHSSSQSSGEL